MKSLGTTFRRALPWVCVCLSSSLPVRATDISSVGVYSVVNDKTTLSTDVSAFIAGYLSNQSGYTAHNLDLYVLTSLAAARRKAARLGLEAVLAADVKGFREEEGSAEVDFRLLDSASGELLRSWSTTLEAPYFDPPSFRSIKPYGNLEQALSAMTPPRRAAEPTREIRLLVVSNQRLRGSGQHTREYLQSQLDIASRVYEREFGIRLAVVQIRRWAPPRDADIVTIAKAAVTIRGRHEVDLTLVCVGPPAPMQYGHQRILGYARPLNNIVVNRVMNAHVFVHEIGHVLGAVHVGQPDCIMQPHLQEFAIDGRLKVLPPILFSDLNRTIIEAARDLPLGSDLAGSMEKAQGMLDAYESLRTQGRIVEVAPLYGDLLMTMGRWDEAIGLFEDSLDLAPNDATVRGMLIEAFSQAGRYEEAQALAQQEFDIRQAQVKGMSGGQVSLKARATLRLSASSIDFGVVEKGMRQTRTLAISNIGTDALVVTDLRLSGSGFSFPAGSRDDHLLQAGESVEVEVIFTPTTAAGVVHGELIVETADHLRASVRILGKVK